MWTSVFRVSQLPRQREIASTERGGYNVATALSRRALFCRWNRRSPLSASVTLFGLSLLHLNVAQLGSDRTDELTREFDRAN